ncbi:MAG: NAD(P)H-hydrate dehydratase [Puniceicoccales bacterium]|jgi:NAD(P)H-hydrate epimerase|nr:NAD(P)H-hydrate dehydratase [Puniceicoccales bacterium]
MNNPPANTTFPGTMPVLACAGAAEFEKDFFSRPGNNEESFIARAARAIADETAGLFAEIRARPIRRLCVLAGKGRNAADALLAAQHLHAEHRCSVGIVLAEPLEKMSATATRALQTLLPRKDIALYHWRDAAGADAFLGGASIDILLDGLLGHNFRPPLRAPHADIVRWANACAKRFKLRIAVDLPSGIGDTTRADTDLALRADATIACGLVKTPLLSPGNAPVRGRLRLACIGFPNTLGGATRAGARGLYALGPLRQVRPPFADKRDHGHLLILGGSRCFPGALLMNVRAALRAGVGLLTVFCPESFHASLAAAAPEAIWVPWPETPGGALALEGECLLRERLPNATALLCGSGSGTDAETHALFRSILTRTPPGCPMVIDADALRPEILPPCATERPAPLVLLPHAGEYARLCAGEAGRQALPLREACARFHAHIALKGAPTRVADAAREITVCTGGAILARGGSGDLLAGITAALFARRLHADPLRTLACAVAWHGAAADCVARRHGTEAIATTDILDGLGEALRK